jgi:DNA polymerase III subunit epsilon
MAQHQRSRSIVFFDVETTGLSPSHGHRIIEIGAISVTAGGAAISEFHSLINPGVPISKEAARVHGITQSMLRSQPNPEEIFPRFRDFINSSLLVAHNALFDLRFLRHEFERLQMSLTHPHVCTLEMSRRRCPHLPNHRLETVHRHLCGPADPSTQTHRALDDARMVAVTLRFGNAGTIRRIGLLLEREGVQASLLRRLENALNQTRSMIPWIPSLPKRGKFNRRWGVVLNEPT